MYDAIVEMKRKNKGELFVVLHVVSVNRLLRNVTFQVHKVFAILYRWWLWFGKGWDRSEISTSLGTDKRNTQEKYVNRSLCHYSACSGVPG